LACISLLMVGEPSLPCRQTGVHEVIHRKDAENAKNYF
jgi:hypothetical protein